ncbi:outer membrane protein assembly factor BamD [Candidatus Spongiihabitans sp.]|uniref:outer membrane protein assembly factor BamD n=1 Tax=Candidatus Spongiihabitans sp. TaxID=3101308 RepID=UPI003C7EB306
MYRIVVMLIAGVLASGCSSFKKEKEDEAESAEQLYEIAKQQMSKKNWQTALDTLRKLEAKYSYGVYAEQAQLDTIYIYYRSKQSDLAIVAADRFIKLHPTHQAVDYAYYLKGLASFSENKSLFGTLTGRDDLSDRDATTIRNAMVAFKELYALFPDSQYALDARIRAGNLLETLARNEIAVANYYYTRKAYVAVVNRAKGIIENYSTTLAVEQALALLMFSYENMGLDDLAGDARRVLALNFPDSGYLNQTTETVKFFNKYSPKSDQPKKQKKGWFSSLFN